MGTKQRGQRTPGIQTVYQVGQNSLTITLPYRFVRQNGIKKGDKVGVVCADHLLQVVPFKRIEKAVKGRRQT